MVDIRFSDVLLLETKDTIAACNMAKKVMNC